MQASSSGHSYMCQLNGIVIGGTLISDHLNVKAPDITKSSVCSKVCWISYFWASVISDVYTYLIPNKTTFIKHCLTPWISKLREIYWVRQYLVNFTGLPGIVNVTVYKTEPIFTGLGHGKLSWFWTLISDLLAPTLSRGIIGEARPRTITLNMLNHLKDYKSYIHILNFIL